MSNVCQFSPISGCCTIDTDCTDNDPCTEDTCDTSSGTCSNTKRDGCCLHDTDCDDSDVCTLDQCDTSTNTCSNSPIACDAGVGPSDAGPSDAGPSVDAGVAKISDAAARDIPVDRGQTDPEIALQGGCGIGVSPRIPDVTIADETAVAGAGEAAGA